MTLHDRPNRAQRPVVRKVLGTCVAWTIALLLVFTYGGTATASQDASAAAPSGTTIGYALTDFYWPVFEAGARQECPDGVNLKPVEQYRETPPLDPHLVTGVADWWPERIEQQFPWREASGTQSYGLNLDGTVGPEDFTSPDGEAGVDNELYRVIGCVLGFRQEGLVHPFGRMEIQKSDYNRLLIEITGIESLVNDEQVAVTFYRGRQSLVVNGDRPLPGSTQQIDTKGGRKFIHTLQGTIVNGVLMTEPADLVLPWTMNNGRHSSTVEWIRAARLRLKLTPQSANGLLAGYSDVATFYETMIKTGNQDIFRYTPLPLYQTLRRRADAYPDPKTGVNTAISSAMHMELIQVFIQHSTDETAGTATVSSSSPLTRN